MDQYELILNKNTDIDKNLKMLHQEMNEANQDDINQFISIFKINNKSSKKRHSSQESLEINSSIPSSKNKHKCKKQKKEGKKLIKLSKNKTETIPLEIYNLEVNKLKTQIDELKKELIELRKRLSPEYLKNMQDYYENYNLRIASRYFQN